VAYRLLATSADVGFITPRDAASAAQIVAEVRADEAAAGRTDVPIRLFADLLVFLDAQPGRAAQRRTRLDDLASTAITSDALIFTGTPPELADLMLDWQSAGLTGFRLRPATIPHDLRQITRGVVPELQRRGAFRNNYESSSLRGLLGLSRPGNRYATA
jgi:alkanesulfonate monooxygenase SsuD/methylene tetrahydromethanopterin reductase-like flavin-dependent oxidoreductase (luciferase family)